MNNLYMQQHDESQNIMLIETDEIPGKTNLMYTERKQVSVDED